MGWLYVVSGYILAIRENVKLTPDASHDCSFYSIIFYQKRKEGGRGCQKNIFYYNRELHGLKILPFLIKTQIIMTENTSRPKRVILKISGEGFCSAEARGIQMDAVVHIAQQTAAAAKSGTQIAIVLGGGNILRGAQFSSGASHIHEATAHYMGMIATVMNGLALQDALESLGQETRVMTAIKMDGVAEAYIRRRALRHLNKGRIIILVAGTGSPFVTTDTAAAQRALELDADVLLKATRVDGVFTADPEKDPNAKLYNKLTYTDVRQQNLRVMDQEAISKCMEYSMPIRVFNFKVEGNIERAVAGEDVGTLITK